MLVFRFSRISGQFEITGTTAGSGSTRGSFRPPVDISYRNKVFTLRIDLPGVNPEDLTIEASDNEIHIAGVAAPGDPPGPCRLMERPSGTFKRTLSFPERISPEDVRASLENGVLTIHIPSPDLSRDPTRIEIRIEGSD